MNERYYAAILKVVRKGRERYVLVCERSREEMETEIRNVRASFDSMKEVGKYEGIRPQDIERVNEELTLLRDMQDQNLEGRAS